MQHKKQQYPIDLTAILKDRGMGEPRTLEVEVPLNQLRTDPVGDMLTNGENLQPYLEHYKAEATGGDTAKTLAAIASLPREKRYVSRIIECLGWALADYTSETVKLDLPYLNNLPEIKNQIQMRTLQLQLLLETLEQNEAVTA